MAKILKFPQTTITDEVQFFWSNLEAIIDYAKQDNGPNTKVAEFLDDHRGLWPHIKADIDANPTKEQMLASAIGCAHGKAKEGK